MIGYLSPEPMMVYGEWALQETERGYLPVAYSYDRNNPLRFVDESGLDEGSTAMTTCMYKCGVGVDKQHAICLGDVRDGDKGNKTPRTKADCDKSQRKGIQQCKTDCVKKHPSKDYETFRNLQIEDDWGDACKGKK